MLDDDEPQLQRFIHWGPIITLGATFFVIYSTYLWWPENQSIFINSAHFGLYLLLSLVSIYNFIMTVLVGPGFVPRRWQPANYEDTKFLQFCEKCEGFKAPRSHHCRKCERCVKKMNHHCPWINGCVGWSNHSHYVFFLFFYLLSNLHAAFVLYCGEYQFSLNRRGYRRYQMVLVFCYSLSLGLSVGCVISLMKLLFIQLRIIFKNMTRIEEWIVEKAINRRRRSNLRLKHFIFPYNLGYLANFNQVFNHNVLMDGMGIVWTVHSGCDQYTLTREQLAQKEDKRKRTRFFKCERNFSGYWLPIISQGFVVSCCIPFTPETRISLQVDDLIRVTRQQSHWLYGERVLSEAEGNDENLKKNPVRGWFPRRCASDITESYRKDTGGEGAKHMKSKVAKQKMV